MSWQKVCGTQEKKEKKINHDFINFKTEENPCIECNGRVVYDDIRGEKVCTECGLVQEEKVTC